MMMAWRRVEGGLAFVEKVDKMKNKQIKWVPRLSQ